MFNKKKQHRKITKTNKTMQKRVAIITTATRQRHHQPHRHPHPPWLTVELTDNGFSWRICVVALQKLS